MESNPFRTSDLFLAAYLCYRGLNLVGCIESGERGRLFFIFEDQSGRDEAIEEWTTGQGDAKQCRKYNTMLRMCKRALKEPVA